jgi:hypothetical protein
VNSPFLDGRHEIQVRDKIFFLVFSAAVGPFRGLLTGNDLIAHFFTSLAVTAKVTRWLPSV